MGCLLKVEIIVQIHVYKSVISLFRTVRRRQCIQKHLSVHRRGYDVTSCLVPCFFQGCLHSRVSPSRGCLHPGGLHPGFLHPGGLLPGVSPSRGCALCSFKQQLAIKIRACQISRIVLLQTSLHSGFRDTVVF